MTGWARSFLCFSQPQDSAQIHQDSSQSVEEKLNFGLCFSGIRLALDLTLEDLAFATVESHLIRSMG